VKAQRPSLWVEIALTLALITLATILLNAGIFWFILEDAERDRRADLALALSGALTAQLEVEAVGADPAAGYRRILQAYRATEVDVDELYVVDLELQRMAGIAGEPPSSPDDGLRAALFGRSQHRQVDGTWWNERSVVITSPIAPHGETVAALRVRMPLRSEEAGGPWAFVLSYTLMSGALIATFGFGLLRRRLLDPVHDIQAGTMRIAAGEFGHLVEIDGSRELLELCQALNTMSGSLQAYRARTVQQVADLEAANLELQQAQEALVRSEKLAGVGRLAAGLAHEVGNPLAAVVGFVDLLAQGDTDPEMARDLIDRSRRELGRIHRIIRRLLDYTRAGTGEREVVDVAAALQEAAETVRPQPGFREIALEVSAPADLPAVFLEADKLHQVLVNLLLNAAHAVSAGGGSRVSLRAATVDEGRTVELRCEDDGTGFSHVAMDRAFEPFFTTKDVGDGTGLGLATCLQVAVNAGGSASVENRTGGGACVRIRLPSHS